MDKFLYNTRVGKAFLTMTQKSIWKLWYDVVKKDKIIQKRQITKMEKIKLISEKRILFDYIKRAKNW